MQEIIARHHEQVAGTLSGFDRVVFRGSLRRIAYVKGMQGAEQGARPSVFGDLLAHCRKYLRDEVVTVN